MARVISGMVPNPNRTRYKAPKVAPPLAIAPNTAIYTSPQGNKPFKIPNTKKVLEFFFFRNTPSKSFTFATSK